MRKKADRPVKERHSPERWELKPDYAAALEAAGPEGQALASARWFARQRAKSDRPRRAIGAGE